MPENPDKKYHRNSVFGVPTMGEGGPLNVFSHNSITKGDTPIKFGPGQEMSAANATFRLPSSPKAWYPPGSILGLPKVVIVNTCIPWPEFWKITEFEFPRDVIGVLLGGLDAGAFGNYYYLDQWDRDGFTKSSRPGCPKRLPPCTTDGNEYRYHQVVGECHNVWTAQNKAIQESLDDLATQLAPQGIAVINGGLMPPTPTPRNTTKDWTAWRRNNPYYDGGWKGGFFGQDCDIFFQGLSRCRSHLDPDCNVSASSPTSVPSLLTIDPVYAGVDILHIYIGAYCHNWGDTNITWHESYPVSPAGLQLGPIVTGTYLGSNTPFFDGQRDVWRGYGLDYGYMDSATGNATGNVASRLNWFDSSNRAAADAYKANFWKVRNMRTMFFNWEEPLTFNWSPLKIKLDQKWCPAPQFYTGYSFAEFAGLFTTEDHYFVDDSGEVHLPFCGSYTQFPDSPSIRAAIGTFFPPLKRQVESYYQGIYDGTDLFMQGMIDRYGLADYGITREGPLNTDLAEVIVDYFKPKKTIAMV